MFDDMRCRQKVQYFRLGESFLNHENVIGEVVRPWRGCRTHENQRPSCSVGLVAHNAESYRWNIVDQQSAAGLGNELALALEKRHARTRHGPRFRAETAAIAQFATHSGCSFAGSQFAAAKLAVALLTLTAMLKHHSAFYVHRHQPYVRDHAASCYVGLRLFIHGRTCVQRAPQCQRR